MRGVPDALWAGACDVDITPGLGAELAGYFHSRSADRIERRLYAKALALRSAEVTIILVSCDTIMVSHDIVARAKALIAEQTGVPSDRVLVSATHSHSTPGTVPELGVVVVDPAYVARLTEAIARAAVGAVTSMVPARVGYGQTPVTGVCFNRRQRRTDGRVEFNPGPGRDDLVGAAGPVDPLVTGMVVEDHSGAPLAFWSNLSLHYVEADSPTAISADYYGAVTERLRRLLGSPVHVQVTNGCSGDINNVDRDRGVPEKAARRAELVATAVAGAVAASTMMAPRHTAVELSANLVEVELERAPVTDQDRRIAQDFLAGLREDLPLSYVNGLPISENMRPYFAAKLLELGDLADRRTAPVMVMRIGELCLVGLPGEVFVEHGLRIREQSPHRFTAVIGLANDHVGYLPTQQACTDGGYETWRNSVSWTAPGSGERLVDSAVALMSHHGEPGRPSSLAVQDDADRHRLQRL